MKRSNVIGILAAAAVIGLSVVLISWYLTKRTPTLIQGTVECTTYKASSKVPGRIDDMKVAQGDRVEKGQLLYTLSTPELEAKLRQAEAVKSAAAALDALPAKLVEKRQLTAVAVTAQPAKRVYLVGEPLNLTGLVVTASYSDGTSEAVAVAADQVTGFDSAAPVAGQAVAVAVGDQQASFTVAVVDAGNLLTKILRWLGIGK